MYPNRKIIHIDMDAFYALWSKWIILHYEGSLLQWVVLKIRGLLRQQVMRLENSGVRSAIGGVIKKKLS
jgi:nucleotidyltransferase/DNA polymerase involved in DNA repair